VLVVQVVVEMVQIVVRHQKKGAQTQEVEVEEVL